MFLPTFYISASIDSSIKDSSPGTIYLIAQNISRIQLFLEVLEIRVEYVRRNTKRSIHENVERRRQKEKKNRSENSRESSSQSKYSSRKEEDENIAGMRMMRILLKNCTTNKPSNECVID